MKNSTDNIRVLINYLMTTDKIQLFLAHSNAYRFNEGHILV